MDETLPHIDFATFVLSLSHSALMHLGEAPHPETGKVEKDLALARQTIDLIGMLEEKTKGNLTGDEEKLAKEPGVYRFLEGRIGEGLHRRHGATDADGEEQCRELDRAEMQPDEVAQTLRSWLADRRA